MPRFMIRFILLFCLGSPFFAKAQLITYLPPAGGVSVCETETHQVTLQNNGGGGFTNLSLSIQLPDCLEYVSGTITGGTEEDIDNLSAPIFTLPDLPSGQNALLQLQIRAGCACVEAINDGTLFFNSITLHSDQGNSTLTTDLYEIETPLLVITDIDDAYLSGSKGDILQRSITIQNTRFGPLEAFRFSDSYQAGIFVTTDIGQVVNSQNGYIELLLNGSDFSLIGDGDPFFEFEESITITETILISDCGISNNGAVSNFSVSWECDDQACQQVEQTAFVQFLPSLLAPHIEAVATVTTPDCYCGDGGAVQELVFTNTGDESAFNIAVDLLQKQSFSGIDPNSFLLDSAGQVTSLPAFGSETPDFVDTCAFQNPLNTFVTLTIPALSPNETVTLSWEVVYCNRQCNQALNNWVYDFEYEQPCPPASIVEGDSITVFSDEPLLLATVDNAEFVETGDTAHFFYELEYPFLTSQDQLLTLEILFPCAFSWMDYNTMELGGALPATFELIDQDSQFLAIVQYDLPLFSNSPDMNFDLQFFCDTLCLDQIECQDTTLTSCPFSEACDPEPEPTIPIFITTSLNSCTGQEPGCGIQSCATASAPYYCQPDSLCIDTIPGYAFVSDFQFGRINLGLPDNDNDRIPDGSGTLNMDLIRTDRSIQGDTVESRTKALVITDLPDTSFRYATLELSFTPFDYLPLINGTLLSPELGITAISSDLTIYDADNGIYYECGETEFSTDSLSNELVFYYSVLDPTIPNTSCNLPPGFRLEEGDSIFMTTRHRLLYNIRDQDPFDPAPEMIPVVVSPNVVLYNNPLDEDEHFFICGCSSQVWEISAYEQHIFPGLFAVPPCDTSAFQGATFFEIKLHQGNFFPYEIRSLGSFHPLQIEIPPSFTIAANQISQLKLQDGPTIKSNEPVPFQFDNGKWLFDLEDCYELPLDEGFSGTLQYGFLADCNESGKHPFEVEAFFNWAPGIPEPTPKIFSDSADILNTLIPGFQAFAPLPFYVSQDNKGRWLINLFNQVNTIASQPSGIAPNCWIQLESPTGALSDFVVRDTTNGTVINPVNGIYSLGDFQPNELRTYEVIVLNQSCTTEELAFRYGWNCEPMTANTTPCSEQLQLLEVLSPPGEIEMIVESPDDSCATLCDLVPYHTITLFNADLGAICDLQLEAVLPQGFLVAPGTSQLEYPEGSGFTDIPNPVDLGNGIVRWTIADYNTFLESNCLSGINGDTLSRLQLRFQGVTDCSFTANSRIIFSASGNQNCGDPGNTITRQGDPICIQVLVDPPQATSNTSLNEPISCQNTESIRLEFSQSEESSPTDSLSVTLPSGTFYIPGSIIPIQNAPQQEPNVVLVNGKEHLSWAFPPGLPPNTMVVFQMLIEGFAELPCGESFFTAQTTSQTDALCALTGDTCSINVQTSQNLLPFDIQRPEYQITAFTGVASEGSSGEILDYTLQIESNGMPGNQQLFVDFYLDTDEDQQWSAADAYMATHSTGGVFTSITMEGQLEVPESGFCRLIAVIDSSKHCACSVDFAFLDGPVQFLVEELVEICPNTASPIGFCRPGFSASWTPADFLSCDTCCQPDINVLYTGLDPLELMYVEVLYNDSGCEVYYEIPVMVSPMPQIVFADTSLCFGETATLIASAGQQYNWNGPGLSSSDQQVVTVTPDESAWYAVSIEDENACIGTDSVWVYVQPLPPADAGPDTTFCPDQLPLLPGVSFPAYEYQWSPSATLSNPNIPNPEVVVEAAGTYILQLTDSLGCEQSDTVQIDFSAAPLLSVPAGQTICEETSLILTVSGALHYEWEPLSEVNCLNPPICDSVEVAPANTTIFTVTGYNEALCATSETIEVTTVNDAAINTMEMETCRGEPVFILDELTDEPGLYCDTTVLASGCLSVECIELTVQDTFSRTEEAFICPGEELEYAGKLLSEAGNYLFDLQSEYGCDSTVLLRLEEWSLPTFTPEPAATTLLLGEETQLSIDGPYQQVEWSPSAGLSCTNCPDPVVMPEQAIQYEAIVTDTNGCRQLLTIDVDVIINCDFGKIEFPNAFTPNNDGVNDTFGPVKELGLESIRDLTIWNRWGQVVFEGTANAIEWDGTTNGKAAPSDVYVFIAHLDCVKGMEEEVRYGEVTLIR
jgi:gliding motility-associated-like protein